MDRPEYRFEPDLARASTLPSHWYTNPAMLDAERGAVFGRTWQAVGHAEWVAEPGQYFGCDIAG